MLSGSVETRGPTAKLLGFSARPRGPWATQFQPILLTSAGIFLTKSEDRALVERPSSYIQFPSSRSSQSSRFVKGPGIPSPLPSPLPERNHESPAPRHFKMSFYRRMSRNLSVAQARSPARIRNRKNATEISCFQLKTSRRMSQSSETRVHRHDAHELRASPKHSASFVSRLFRLCQSGP